MLLVCLLHQLVYKSHKTCNSEWLEFSCCTCCSGTAGDSRPPDLPVFLAALPLLGRFMPQCSENGIVAMACLTRLSCDPATAVVAQIELIMASVGVVQVCSLLHTYTCYKLACMTGKLETRR